MTQSFWLVVSPSGHYARMKRRKHRATGATYESWDATDDITKAHLFETKAAAESYLSDGPDSAWRIEELHVSSRGPNGEISEEMDDDVPF